MCWFFGDMPSHLPFSEGPYIAGCSDVMTEYSKDGIFARIYYPTDLKGEISDYKEKWIPWIPGYNYIVGLANVIMQWVIIVRVALWFKSGNIHVPIVYGAKPKSDGRLKCVVFSHGLGANRFMYSTTCVELASRGFLVAAVEHRDNSASSTYYFENEDCVKTNKRTYIDVKHIKFGPDHHAGRLDQVQYRSSECKKVIDLLFDINSGNPPKNVLEVLPGEENNEFRFSLLENKLDLTDITMMGHSFGGATSLLTLATDKRLKQGILLDPWMFPVKDAVEVFEDIKQPLLFVNTQTFHIESNVKAMTKIMEKTNLSPRRMYTILHTTHESQSDSPYAFGYWLNWFMRKLPPLTATRINNSLILQFLNKYIGFPVSAESIDEYLKSETQNFTEGITKAWI